MKFLWPSHDNPTEVMISLFLPSLYADHLGVPLSAIGHVTSAVQIFDAVTDPVLGHVSATGSKRWRSSDVQLISGDSLGFSHW